MSIPEPASTLGLGPATPVPAPAAPAKRDHVVHRLLRDPVAIASIAAIVVITVMSFAAPLLTSADPMQPSIVNSLAGPEPGHPLGFDGVGRDVWSRLLYGGQVSLIGGLLAVIVAIVIGLPIGVVAGYRKGIFDGVTSWIANLLMAIPSILVLLVVLSSVGQGTNTAMVVFGVLMAPSVFRLVRASVVGVREELYVDAARVAGLSDSRIMRRHIVPVVSAPTIIQAAQMLGIAIIIQAGLQFLGVGSLQEASWGAMLNDAFANIYLKPTLLIWPGLAITITVASFALLGSSLRDLLGGTSVKATRRARRAAAAAGTALPQPAKGGAPAGDIVLSDQAVPDDVELLTVRNLKVAYPRSDGSDAIVVRGISLSVHKGEVLGLVGESGSGKTQTAFAVLGLLPPEAKVIADTVAFGGQNIVGLSKGAMNRLRGLKIAYIPQEPMSNLDPSFRIGFQITEPMRQHLGISRKEAKEKALALLARVGIPEPERTYNAYPHEVSGGMAQRVLIAGAVSCDPDLLIADEPTTALDVTVQAEVLDLMRSLQEERKMGMILVTHDFGVVADICDRIAVMRTGEIVEMAPARELFANPQHEYTRMLLESTLEDSELRTPLAAAAVARHESAQEARS